MRDIIKISGAMACTAVLGVYTNWHWIPSILFLYLVVALLSAVFGKSGPALPETETPQAELDTVRQRVEAIREQARREGIPDALIRLYRTYHVATWEKVWPELTHGDPPEGVIRASQLSLPEKDKSGGITVLEFTTGDTLQLRVASKYIHLPDGDGFTSVSMELKDKDAVVFAMSLHEDSSNEYGPIEWRPVEIESYIVGPWVETLLKMIRSLDALQNSDGQQRRVAAQEREAADLKSRFGLK